MAAGSGLWGRAGGAMTSSMSSEGAQWLWGMLRTWQQTLHTSAGFDLERGFERGREGKREQHILLMRSGEAAWLGEELWLHSLLAPLTGTDLVA